MATDEAQLRDYLIEHVVESVPRGCLEDFHRRALGAYRDKFQDVKHDSTTVPEQRLAKLIQDRVFRMDWELAEAANAHGLSATSKPLPENGWAYTYIVAGRFGITQSYVPTIGALPKPAKFRDGLAKAAGMPRLPLDDPEEIYQVKEFYALLAHNPLGRRFSESEQQLGTLQFCIPCNDMKDWAFSMSVAELLSYYPTKPTTVSTARAPTWKSRPDHKTRGS